MRKVKAGETEEGPYSSVTGVELAGGARNEDDDNNDEEDVSSSSETSEDDEDNDSGIREKVFKDGRRPRDESPSSRKVRNELCCLYLSSNVVPYTVFLRIARKPSRKPKLPSVRTK